MSEDVLRARMQSAVGLATAFNGRAPDGSVDRTLLGAMLGDDPTEDDFIDALGNAMLLNEILLLMLFKATGKAPRDTLREIALHQQRDV